MYAIKKIITITLGGVIYMDSGGRLCTLKYYKNHNGLTMSIGTAF